MEKELGVGNFSKVFKVEHKQTHEIFGLKQVEKTEIQRLKRRHPNIQNELLMEKQVLSDPRMRHPGIVRLFHTFQDERCLYFLMDYLEGGELWDLMKYGKHQVALPHSTAKFYSAQVLAAVQHLHQQGIVHRDLKPENVMLTMKGQAKLIDFGTAKNLQDTKLNGPEFVGTAQYMPPEAVTNGKPCPADCSSDLWSYGCMVYQMYVGLSPFKAASDYLSFCLIQRHDPEKFFMPDCIPQHTKDLIRKLTRQVPTDRLGGGGDCPNTGYAALRAHPHFARDSAGWDSIPLESPPPHTEEEKNVMEICSRIYQGTYASSNLEGGETLYHLPPLQKAVMVEWLLKTGKLFTYAWIYPLFHESFESARFNRIRGRGVIGNSHLEEHKWMDCNHHNDEPSIFFIVISNPRVGLEGAADALEAAVKSINMMVPTPKFVAICGDITGLQQNQGPAFERARKILAKLWEEIELLIVIPEVMSEVDPSQSQLYEDYFGNVGYYAFWAAGVKCIVLDETPFQHEQEKDFEDWFDVELSDAKLTAHHSFVFSSTLWKRKNPNNSNRKNLFERMKDNQITALIGTAGVGEREEVKPKKKPKDNEPRPTEIVTVPDFCPLPDAASASKPLDVLVVSCFDDHCTYVETNAADLPTE